MNSSHLLPFKIYVIRHILVCFSLYLKCCINVQFHTTEMHFSGCPTKATDSSGELTKRDDGVPCNNLKTQLQPHI